MEITQDVVNLVRKASKRIMRCPPQRREELEQDILFKLFKNQTVIENVNAFIYKTVYYEHVCEIRNYNFRKKTADEYRMVASKTSHMCLKFEAVHDLNLILASFDKKSAKYKTLKFMIDHPDMRVDHMARSMEVNLNTFKANVKHIKNKIKKEGWV